MWYVDFIYAQHEDDMGVLCESGSRKGLVNRIDFDCHYGTFKYKLVEIMETKTETHFGTLFPTSFE